MNHSISKFIRHRVFYKLWSNLHSLSMYGMNYGVSSGYADYSGELYIIKKIVENGVVFDIGANVGDWSNFFIKEHGNFNLYMFEPSLCAFEALKNNISATSKIHFYKIGFGESIKKANIYYDYNTQGSASILNSKASISEEIEIETIDSFCEKNNINEIDFIKMDVQGYEYNILLGALKMIEKESIKVIQFEIDEPSIDNRVFFKDFWVLLSERYYIYRSLYNGLVKIDEYSPAIENYTCMNYLAVLKKEKF